MTKKNKNVQLTLFDLMDIEFAETIGIPVKEYVRKAESLSDKRMDIVLMSIMDCQEGVADEKKLEQLKRIFKNIE